MRKPRVPKMIQNVRVVEYSKNQYGVKDSNISTSNNNNWTIIRYFVFEEKHMRK